MEIEYSCKIRKVKNICKYILKDNLIKSKDIYIFFYIKIKSLYQKIF